MSELKPQPNPLQEPTNGEQATLPLSPERLTEQAWAKVYTLAELAVANGYAHTTENDLTTIELGGYGEWPQVKIQIIPNPKEGASAALTLFDSLEPEILPPYEEEDFDEDDNWKFEGQNHAVVRYKQYGFFANDNTDHWALRNTDKRVRQYWGKHYYTEFNEEFEDYPMDKDWAEYKIRAYPPDITLFSSESFTPLDELLDGLTAKIASQPPQKEPS